MLRNSLRYAQESFYRLRRSAVTLALLSCSATIIQAQPRTTAPSPAAHPGALKDGWEEIDQRLVFLTEELSSVESSLTAINKAMRANGFEKPASLTKRLELKIGSKTWIAMAEGRSPGRISMARPRSNSTIIQRMARSMSIHFPAISGRRSLITFIEPTRAK